MPIIRISWFLLAIILHGFSFNSVSEARHLKKLPSALVVGSVYCDTCLQEEFSKTSHFISGALVAVECRGSSSDPSFREEVKTDENGEFKVHLPFSVHKLEKAIKACSVKLISSSEPRCAVASTAPSSSFFNLKSKKQDTHIFSAGFFSFKPLKEPFLCKQNSKKFSTSASANPLKPSKLSNGEAAQQTFLPPLPLIPLLPSPAPPFGLPLPPNPFQPPPSILPPNPFKPPPSIFPPIPFPPFPGLTPPPPPPPPPRSIFPPIPFPPIPGFTPPSPPLAFPIPVPPFPGIPPASSTKYDSP